MKTTVMTALAALGLLFVVPARADAPATYVSDISMASSKSKNKWTVTALVRVRNQLGEAVEGAAVYGIWTLPGGIQNEGSSVVFTSSTGEAFFQVTNRSRGTYTFHVQDVVLEGHSFDRDRSVTSASIVTRNKK